MKNIVKKISNRDCLNCNTVMSHCWYVMICKVHSAFSYILLSQKSDMSDRIACHAVVFSIPL